MNQDFESRMQALRKLVQVHIAQLLEQGNPQSLYDPMRYALQAGGKLLRPLLALVSCGSVGGKIEDALDAAAALELAHNFTLVHDDIMDNDALRRGRETVHKKWNANVGILAGDAILVKAYKALNAVPPRHLPRVLQEFNLGILMVCEGQAMDMDFEERQDVTLDEYFNMINHKTAQLFSLSCILGAILGNGSEKEIEALGSFGRKLGRAFQLQDDLLDILSDQETLGKDIGSDMQANKKTFLMLYAKANSDKNELLQFDRLKQKERLSAADIQQVIKIMKNSGAIDAANSEIKSALTQAHNALEQLQETIYKTMLAGLLNSLENRTS